MASLQFNSSLSKFISARTRFLSIEPPLSLSVLATQSGTFSFPATVKNSYIIPKKLHLVSARLLPPVFSSTCAALFYRKMAFVNCTTYFCTFVSIGYSENCPVYKSDCSPCWLNCTQYETVLEDCFEWDCSGFPATTTKSPPSTTRAPPGPPVNESATFAIVVAIIVFCTLLGGIIVLWWRKRSRFVQPAFLEEEEDYHGENPENSFLLSERRPRRPNSEFDNIEL